MKKPSILVLHDERNIVSLLETRFFNYQSHGVKILLLDNASKLSKLTRVIEEQKPEAILSNSLGGLWDKAYKIAEKHKTPFVIYTPNKLVVEEARKMDIKCYEKSLDSDAIYYCITHRK